VLPISPTHPADGWIINIYIYIYIALESFDACISGTITHFPRKVSRRTIRSSNENAVRISDPFYFTFASSVTLFPNLRDFFIFPRNASPSVALPVLLSRTLRTDRGGHVLRVNARIEKFLILIYLFIPYLFIVRDRSPFCGRRPSGVRAAEHSHLGTPRVHHGRPPCESEQRRYNSSAAAAAAL